MVEHLVDVVADALAGVVAVDASHQQIVVAGVLVTDRREDGEFDRALLQGAPCGTASDASAAPRGGVASDCPGARRRTAGEQIDDLPGEALLQGFVLGRAPLPGTLPAP